MDATPHANFEAMLHDIAQCGVRAVHVVTNTMEAEQALIQLVTAALPTKADPASLADAITAGLDIETAAATLRAAGPRIEAYAEAYDKLTRSIRRTIALHRRLQNGWTGMRPSDTRAAMQKRQVKNAVRHHIGDEPDDELGDEPAENLFADLNELLDDPGLEAEIAATSVEAVVKRICADLDHTANALHRIAIQSISPNQTRAHPPDTG